MSSNHPCNVANLNRLLPGTLFALSLFYSTRIYYVGQQREEVSLWYKPFWLFLRFANLHSGWKPGPLQSSRRPSGHPLWQQTKIRLCFQNSARSNRNCDSVTMIKTLCTFMSWIIDQVNAYMELPIICTEIVSLVKLSFSNAVSQRVCGQTYFTYR